MTEHIEIFIHRPGKAPQVAKVGTDEVLLEALKGNGVEGIAEDSLLVFVDECGDALMEAIEVDNGEDTHEPSDPQHTVQDIGIKHGKHVHVNACRRIQVTVTYNNREVHHKFSPATTVGTATKWAKGKFKIGPSDDFVLQVSGTTEIPRQNEHLGDLVAGGVCALSFDLVREVTPQGYAPSPSERALIADMESAAYRDGVARGQWGVPEGVQPEWPLRYFWIAAAPREGSATRFVIRIDCDGYRTVQPTGNFWDLSGEAFLTDPNRRPKGRPGSTVEKVFRTDWENGTAFYHPYDRKAFGSHVQWAGTCANRIWSDRLTIVDYLDEFHRLLNSGDYIGGKG